MEFIHLFNLSTVTWVNNSDNWWDNMPPHVYEAISPFGEIKAFTTYEAANTWRIAQVKDAYEWSTEKLESYDIDGTLLVSTLAEQGCFSNAQTSGNVD